MTAACTGCGRPRRRYKGPLVIRAPRPEGAIDLAALEDAERAARRRAAREAAWRASWRGRLHGLREALLGLPRAAARGPAAARATVTFRTPAEQLARIDARRAAR